MSLRALPYSTLDIVLIVVFKRCVSHLLLLQMEGQTLGGHLSLEGGSPAPRRLRSNTVTHTQIPTGSYTGTKGFANIKDHTLTNLTQFLTRA